MSMAQFLCICAYITAHVLCRCLQVFGGLDFSRRDLMALNIQRARDHGLPDYNTARMSFGLPRVNSYREINPTIFDNFEEADNTYSTTRDVRNINRPYRLLMHARGRYIYMYCKICNFRCIYNISVPETCQVSGVM